MACQAMGTRFEIAIVRTGAGQREAALLAAGEAALAEIQEWHHRLTRFSPDSFTSHLARTAHRDRVHFDLDTGALLRDALSVWRASDGAFDITVAPAMAARGFADSAVSTSDAALNSGAIDLDEDAGTVGFTAPLALDFGAIGKGHALDCAAAVLRRAGVHRAFLHGGTSSGLAMGRGPDDGPWRVALDATGSDVISLVDASFSLSDCESQRSADGSSHLIDPRRDPRRTGADASGARVLVTGPSARLADAWSTALAVAGEVPAMFPANYTARWM